MYRRIQDRPASEAGFTMVELLVVVVVIGVLAAIGIPTLINALDRGRQKRTMADIRTIATAVENYCVDNNIYPTASDWTALVATIEGDYVRRVIRADGWGHALVYDSDAANYTIGSAGKDGGGTLALVGSGGPTNGFDDDIIYSNGSFVQWPEGRQED